MVNSKIPLKHLLHSLHADTKFHEIIHFDGLFIYLNGLNMCVYLGKETCIRKLSIFSAVCTVRR